MIRPYYETELGKLYHGDCLEVMQQLPDKSVDLVLTDPPYGIKEAAGKNKSRNKGFGKGNLKSKKITFSKDYGNKNWDNKPIDKKYFQVINDISQNQIIFGANHFIENLVIKNSSCWLVWDKLNGGSDFADCELAWTSFKSAVRKFTFKWNGLLQHDMKNKEIRYHPTQKPVKLFEMIIKKYSNTSDTILDPFMGSGTTAIACENLDRKWIGIEQDKSYCDIAVKRISEARQQLKLFSFADI